MEKKKLGRLECRILDVLWKLGHATSSEIMLSLPRPKPAYVTLSLSLRILNNQKIIAHQKNGRVYTYYPLWGIEIVLKNKITELADDFFSGDQQMLLETLIRIDTN